MIINLTPHTVTVLDGNNNIIAEFISEGNARCTQTTKQVGTFQNVPITQAYFGQVVDLPVYRHGMYYIVSRLVMQACPDRPDLLVPNELVRDSEGRIIGCKSLASN